MGIKEVFSCTNGVWAQSSTATRLQYHTTHSSLYCHQVMVDFNESSQLNLWMYGKPEHLSWLREKANYTARCELYKAEAAAANNSEEGHPSSSTAAATMSADPTRAHSFARGWARRWKEGAEGTAADYENLATQGPLQNAAGHPYPTSAEEATLVQFYAPKLSSLVGPSPVLPKLCKRNSKVTATAALLYRRFFLSNSVLYYDPKAVLVAAAFLASKTEDAMVHASSLQQATRELQTEVTLEDILTAECALLQGVAFDILCFPPFQAVLALTEDLRTYLKSEKGRSLVPRPVSSQDLQPLYVQARQTLEKALLQTDGALLYTPGQLALGSLVVAQDVLIEKAEKPKQDESVDIQAGTDSNPNTATPLTIDWHGYVHQRFDTTPEKAQRTWEAVQAIRNELLPLSVETPPPPDWAALKAIHKKLKKVRIWGKSKKRKNKDDGTEDRPSKRTKVENP